MTWRSISLRCPAGHGQMGSNVTATVHPKGMATATGTELASEEVRRRVPGLTYRMLYTWTQKGYVLPVGGLRAVMFNPGPGYAYRYYSSLVQPLRLMVALTGAGWSPKSASALALADDWVVQLDDYLITVTPR